VLVRKLLGIETAGSLNTLFLDKTGTITRGRFEPQLFLGADGSRYDKFGVRRTIDDVWLLLSVWFRLENESMLEFPFAGDAGSVARSARADVA
jgi:magnesium-transporting ATPase (P-type)